MNLTKETYAMRVSRNTVIVNILLAGGKLLAGIFGHSAAMLSDAVHSLSDVFSTLVVMAGIKMAGKKADKEHPYGHERLECVAAILLAVMLCLTGVGIGYTGARTIVRGDYGALAIPGGVALVAATVSVAVKEGMYWYTRAAAKRISSGAMMADAWHHRSDALSSVGSFAGILGARLGFPVLDAVACLVICLLIVKASYDIFADAVRKMVDQSCDDETIEQIRALVLERQEVVGIDLLQTRLFGDKIYIDMEISLDGNASLCESHAVAHAIHDLIEERFSNVKHCMIHMNPCE